jgi:uncharacterized protein YndB with AHSA1/START domain
MMNQPRVHVVRELAAARETVFQAWLDPEMLAAFLRPAPGATVVDPRVDAREGGGFQLTMVIGEKHLPVHGRYLRIDRFDRLEFTWLGTGGLDSSVVTLRFESLGPSSTRLTLEHVGLPSDELARDHHGGWSEILERLAAALGER